MIRVLDKSVADKIAAGEVIDRPVSIVKELVENALDAEARTITVEMRKGGKEYLRITDDGCGIASEEVETAFLRHATSKIETESDLDAIRSLGFRGEALASVGAVARVDMITKPSDAHTGRHVICEGSDILSNAPTGCPEGTTITVRDLFYNLPARRKFLASDGAEARRIIDLLSRIALAYPDVRFRLLNGRQEVFQTSGRGSILDNIIRIYGRDLGKDLVQVDRRSGDAQQGGMLLRGFVSSPGASATNRSRQFFCVNGRVVSSRTMERGLEKAYRERLFPGRFPIAFLFLQLPADQLDVNVHPTKKEVRFDDAFAVEDFITEAVAAALQEKPAIPAVQAGGDLQEAGPDAPAAPAVCTGGTHPPKNRGASDAASPAASSPFEAPAAGHQVDIKKLLQSMRNETQLQEESFDYDPGEGVVRQAPPDSGCETEPGSAHEPGKAPEHKASESAGPSDAPAIQAGPRLDIEALQVVGTVFATYIIAVEGDTMYLIDQHAAHERIFYEKLLAQYHAADKYAQELLLPLQISVSAEVEHAEEAWIGYLRQMGYEIENFGSRRYIVRAMPAFADGAEGERFLREMLRSLEEAPDVRSFASLDRLIMRSCKSAVKGGDLLHPEEIQALLQQLADCENPWSCPHGRPTIIRMRRSELERMFKR